MSDAAEALQGEDLAYFVADCCDEKKAEDITILDVSDALGVTEFFVICSVNNPRQARVVAQHCEQSIKQMGGWRNTPLEGLSTGNWVCADFSDVILHVFLEETRTYYDLESHWGDVPRLEWSPSEGSDEEDDEELEEEDEAAEDEGGESAAASDEATDEA